MYQTLGDRLRELRKARGLNQDQLAELASLNRVTIAKYEAGRVEPGAQALARLADALDVTVDALLNREAPEIEKDDRMELLERIREDRDFRLLYAAAMKASPEHIRAATAMLNALKPEDFPE